jgi:valyl-tRNA synthetase
MNAEQINLDQNLILEHNDFVDEWIESKFQNSLNQVNNALDKFEINNATKIIYSFVWSDFCDWYVELTKNRIYSSDNNELKSAVLTRAINLFEKMLKLLHPFMPFITEELWNLTSERKEGESISISQFPIYDQTKINKTSETKMNFLQGVISGIRNIRGEMNIPPSKKVNVLLKTENITEDQIGYIKTLGKVEELNFGIDITKPKGSASTVLKECEIYIPLEGIIDLNVEKDRLTKEINRLEGALIGVNKKLSNEKFVNSAPKEVVEKEVTKKSDWESSLTKLKTLLSELS